MNHTLEEILEEIFQHLSSTQLHNAMQVCKRWSETIFTSPKLQMNMILDISFNTTSEALEKSKCFSYKTIILTMDGTGDNQLSSSQAELRKFDANVKEIFSILGNELEILKINNLVRLMPMLLLKTPNLISLNLESVDADDLQLRSFPSVEPEHDLGNNEEQTEQRRQTRPRMQFGGQVNPFMDLPIDHFEQNRLLEQNRGFREAELQTYPQFNMHRHYIERPVEPIFLGVSSNIHPQVMQRFNIFRLDFQNNPTSKLELLRVYPNVPIVSLKHLKFLEIKTVSRVLCWIEAPNLKALIVHDSSKCDGIEEFLMTTEKLENLVMDQFVASKFENLEKSKFQLRKLQINCINEHQLTDQNQRFVLKLTKFLNSQKQSLQELTMTFHTIHSDVVKLISFINNHFKLSNLSIKFTLGRPIDRFTTTINSVVSRNLSVLNNFKNIISSCVSVTSLDINFDMLVETEVLDHLAVSMPNLKSLSIHPFFTKVSSSTVFENLESLKITKLREGPHTATWYEIAMTCPNIKELTLVDEVFEISPMKLKMVLENAKSLKFLNLTGSHRFVISEEVLKVFMDENNKVRRINVQAKMSEKEFHKKMRILTENSNVQTVLHQIF